MASRFWVGGTGTWDGTTTTHWSATTGGAGGASVPTATDDVFFDANSGGGTATTSTVTGQCRNLDATGFTGSIAMTASVTVNGPVFTLGASMASTGMTGVANVNFGNTTDTTTTTVTCNGKSISAVNVNGTHVTFSQADALVCTNTFTLTAGTWIANNFSWTIGKYALGVGTKTQTLGTSSGLVTASSTNWDAATNNAGLTLSAASSTITCSGASNQFNGGNNSVYGTVNFTGSGNAILSSGPWSCTNLNRTGTGVKTDTFQHGTTATITVTGTLTINGNSATNRMLFQSNTVGTARTISAASVSITNCDFQDIAAAGAGNWDLHAITGLSGDCGGNSGITFTTPATQTHTASAGGNWSDVTKWTSRVPLPQDNVIVNVNTTGTLTADMPRIGASIDFTGFAATFVCSVTGSIVTILGSLTLASGMTWTPQNTFVCQGRGNQTITSHGITTPTFVVQAGTYVPQDALAGADNTRSFSVQAVGVFDNSSNNVSVTYSAVNVLNTSSLIAGAATWTLTATSGTVWNHTAGTMSAASATIVISAASTSARTFAGLGKTYGTVTYTVANSPGQLVITGANTFANLNIGPGRQLQMPASTTNTFANAPSWSGSPNGYLYLPGVAGNYASTPDSAALSITGDIDVRVRVALDNWTAAANQMLVSHSNSNTSDTAFQFRIDSSGGHLSVLLSSNGAAASTATGSVPGFANGTTQWVRFTWRASDGRVQFFTADGSLTNPAASDFAQLGVNLTLAIGSIFNSTVIVEMGSTGLGTANLTAGKFYRAQMCNGIDGPKVLDADFTAKTVGANTFTESSTNAATVTINGTLAQAGDGRVALTSSTPGTQWTVNYTGTGVVNSDYLTIQDSNATPGSIWYAGTHSTNVSNNTGWTFTVGGVSGFSGSGSLVTSVVPAVPVNAALTGSGSLVASAVPSPAIALSLTGSGALTSSAVPVVSDSEAFTGSGALTASAVPSLAAATSFTGSGTLTSSVVPSPAITISFTGTGTLSEAAEPGRLAPAAFSGAGSLVTVVLPALMRTVVLIGSGALSTAGVPAVSTGAVFVGSGVLRAVRYTPPPPERTRIVSQELRLMRVRAENRVCMVEAESRVIRVQH